MHSEVLTPEAAALFPKLSSFRGDFYLAGGTALALQLGHRVSVDFDLFSGDKIGKTFLSRVEGAFGLHNSEVVVQSSRELTLYAHGVKCTFLHYPFPLMIPLVSGEAIPLMDAREILATKAYTIGRRGSFKDYVDVFIGLRSGASSLSEVIAMASKKFGDGFNDRLFLEQLLFLDDLEEEPLEMLHGAIPSRQDITEFFSKEVKQISLL